MKWTLSLLAVPLLYLLSVPWVARLETKITGSYVDKFYAYYRPWKWLCENTHVRLWLWDYALWCDRAADGETDQGSNYTFWLMHPEEQP